MAKQITLIIFMCGIFLCDGAGERCTIPSADGIKYGICENWSKCKIAQDLLKKRNIPPIYCGYDKDDPEVCCPLSVSSRENYIVERSELRQRLSGSKCMEMYNLEFTNRYIGGNYVRHDRNNSKRETPEQFRHMVAIGWKRSKRRFEYEYDCGGSLISEYFILTAAHCTSVRGEPPAKIRIGGENLKSDFADEVAIKKIHIHPSYNKKQRYHDIALIELKYSSFLDPACLWQSNNIRYDSVTAIGYGHTAFGGNRSDYLVKGDLRIYPNDDCKPYYPSSFSLEDGIIESQLCAGDPTGMQDTCQGDSGGPLMIKVNVSFKTIPFILGVTSFGRGCAGGTPSIYTRVSSYLDWIESIVWPQTDNIHNNKVN